MGETYRINQKIKKKKIKNIFDQKALLKSLDELDVEIVPRIPPNDNYDGFMFTTWFKSYLATFTISELSNPVVPFPPPWDETHKAMYDSLHKKNYRWKYKTAKVYEKLFAQLQNPIIHQSVDEG